MHKPTVFVSYSHRDENWKDRLLVHLAAVGLESRIEVWDDTRIPTGSEWEQELQQAMENAEIALLLVSADFLASEYIRRRELPSLLELADDGLKILPIIVRPCAWQTVAWLNSLEVLPRSGVALSGGDENTIEGKLAEVASEVHQAISKRSSKDLRVSAEA